MKPEEQRIAIAEACGWHTIQRNPLYPNDENRLAGFVAGDFTALCGIPDYLRDLNAMHEVEREAPVGYGDAVEYIVARDAGVSQAHICLQYVIHATAAQRAEAFLRTIGKWKEQA